MSLTNEPWRSPNEPQDLERPRENTDLSPATTLGGDVSASNTEAPPEAPRAFPTVDRSSMQYAIALVIGVLAIIGAVILIMLVVGG